MRQIQEQLGEWYPLLKDVIHSPQMQELGKKLMSCKQMTPKWDDVFKAYELCPPSRLKVLILGQDPYIKGEAHGLAFSSCNGTIPYSLQNIFEDLRLSDYDHRIRRKGDLTDWAEQGVMLLNTCLTTEMYRSFAHRNWGWEKLVQAALWRIGALSQHIVVMGWGKPAQTMINAYCVPMHSDNRLLLTAAHPANERYQKGSFIGSRHFQKADNYFKSHGIEPINWYGHDSRDLGMGNSVGRTDTIRTTCENTD